MFRLGFLGGGQMAEMMIGGLKDHAADFHLEYLLYDPVCSRRQYMLSEYGVNTAANNAEVLEKSSVVFVAVKPQIFPEIEDEIAANYREGQIILSIMAGIDIATVGKKLPKDAKIVRLMPNTAMGVGAGVCLFTANDYVTETEKSWLVDMLSSIAIVEEIPEKMMNGAMAISGSGPAYFYTMIDAMTLGGIEVGIPKKLALSLATQTMLGAAEMLKTTGESPADLRDSVLSPAGTTIEGVRALESGGFRNDVIEAVHAAWRRAEEIGGKKE